VPRFGDFGGWPCCHYRPPQSWGCQLSDCALTATMLLGIHPRFPGSRSPTSTQWARKFGSEQSWGGQSNTPPRPSQQKLVSPSQRQTSKPGRRCGILRLSHLTYRAFAQARRQGAGPWRQQSPSQKLVVRRQPNGKDPRSPESRPAAESTGLDHLGDEDRPS